jgi:hypothetical protein
MHVCYRVRTPKCEHAIPTERSRHIHPFRRAIESGESDRLLELFSPEVVFNSPVVFRPYHGREALGVILHSVMRVFEDFRYEREIGTDGAGDHALLFRARVGDRELQGCDLLHTGQDGLIDELTGLALAEAMKTEVLAAESEPAGQALP